MGFDQSPNSFIRLAPILVNRSIQPKLRKPLSYFRLPTLRKDLWWIIYHGVFWGFSRPLGSSSGFYVGPHLPLRVTRTIPIMKLISNSMEPIEL